MATMTITRVETQTKTQTQSIPVMKYKAINEERILSERQRQQTRTPTFGHDPVKMRCPRCHKMITTR